MHVFWHVWHIYFGEPEQYLKCSEYASNNAEREFYQLTKLVLFLRVYLTLDNRNTV